MARHTFKLPDVGEGIAEAEIVNWHVRPGDMIREDEPLVDVMTDKATVEISSPVTGRVIEANGAVGSKLQTGAPLAIFEVDGEGSDAVAKISDSKVTGDPAEPVSETATTHRKTSETVGTLAHEPTAPLLAGTKPKASPAVRRRAEEMGVKLQFVTATGNSGTITHEDLDRYLAGKDSQPLASGNRPVDNIDEVKVIGLRRKIAEKMQEAKRNIPHFSYIEEIDVTGLEALRLLLNARRSQGQAKLTLLPFFIRGLVSVLPDFPQLNATFDDEAGIVRRHSAVHVGIATQTQAGLMVPVIRHAEMRGLWELADEILRLAEVTRAGRALKEELSGSTITLTSLGALGGFAHTPVINRPEVAIIGPNRIVDRPVARGGSITIRKMMNISSSFDHRIVDGYVAAAFIQSLKQKLEYPATIFIE